MTDFILNYVSNLLFYGVGIVLRNLCQISETNDVYSFLKQCLHMHARTHARTHARKHSCTHVRTHPCTHPRTQNSNTYTPHIYIYIYIYIYIQCIYIYTVYIYIYKIYFLFLSDTLQCIALCRDPSTHHLDG